MLCAAGVNKFKRWTNNRTKLMAEKTVNVDMLDFVRYLDCRDSGVKHVWCNNC